jgi:ABC-type sugar transport system, permease component
MEDVVRSEKQEVNKISLHSNIIINVVFILIAILFVLPLILVFMVSISSERAISTYGYQFWPSQFSAAAYYYLLNYAGELFSAYGMSVIVTAIGSVAATFVIALYAYPLSRENFKHRKGFAFFAFFTTIFGGGLVPWVFVYTQLFNISDTGIILIVPYLMNAWFMIIMRTFMKSSVPEELVEAARIDGAGEFKIFARIALPLCKAGLATIFLFCLVKYWNDYYLSLIFITDQHLYTIQYYTYSMMNSIEYLFTNTNIPADARRDLPSESARMALSVFAVGPVVIAYPFFQRFFVKGLIVGAVKG